MTTVIILSLLTAVAATIIAYVIGRWGRTSAIVTSSKSAVGPVTKETACQGGDADAGPDAGRGRGGGDTRRTDEQLLTETKERDQLSSYDDSDQQVFDDDAQLTMSSASSSSSSQLRALLARERSRRRAAEDWATFLVATLDSYVRASRTHDRRLAESGPNVGVQAIRSLFKDEQKPSEGCARCRWGDDVTAVKERRLGRCLDQRNSGGPVTEQPASRDDWETMVRYNEKILQQQNLTITADQRVGKNQQNETAVQLRLISRRVEPLNFKPLKPPKPTSQQTPRRLLPVQQFLHRQLEQDDGAKSSAVIVHGQWSPIRHQYRHERTELAHSTRNNQLLTLLPNRHLPVHRHLQRQLDKEREQDPSTQSRDKEQTKESNTEPCLSLQSQRNFQKTVSVDSVEKSAETEQHAKQSSSDVSLNLLDALCTSVVPGNLTDDVTVTSSSPLMADEAGMTGEACELDLWESRRPVDLDEQTSTTISGDDDVALQTTEPDDKTTEADDARGSRTSSDD